MYDEANCFEAQREMLRCHGFSAIPSFRKRGVSHKAKKLCAVRRQRNRTASDNVHDAPTILDAAFLFKMKKTFGLSIAICADSTSILETERLNVLKVCMKKYFKVYGCSAEGISITFMLNEVSLSKSISKMITEETRNVCREPVKKSAWNTKCFSYKIGWISCSSALRSWRKKATSRCRNFSTNYYNGSIVWIRSKSFCS